MESPHDINRCSFCHHTIEWLDDWCEHGSDVPCEVAHTRCCHICTPTEFPATTKLEEAWRVWCEITDEAECAPDAPLEVVWKRLRARDSERTFAEVADARKAT